MASTSYGGALSSPLMHDYTEGASAADLSVAITNSRHSRRDSQYSAASSDGDVGAIFDGPGHVVNPSSVSRMSLGALARRSSSGEWRRSLDRVASSSRVRRESKVTSDAAGLGESSLDQDEEPSEDDDSGEDIGTSRRHGQRRLQGKTSVFNNLANLFGRTQSRVSESPSRSRRPSLSQHSSASTRRSRRSRRRSVPRLESDVESLTYDDRLERWGYSSGEEDSDNGEPFRSSDADSTNDLNLGMDSFPPSPGASLPMLSSDNVFSRETRINMGCVLDDLKPPPPGPPSRQSIDVPDEGTTILFVGYETIYWKLILWRCGCIATFGVLWLVGHWFPRLWLRFLTEEKAFEAIKDGFVVVETTHRDIAMFPLQRLHYPYPISTVFPSRAEATKDQLSRGLPSTSSMSKMNDNAVVLEDGILGELRFMDYRYSRFALDTRTGLFSAIRNWRDPSWDGVPSVRNGLQAIIRLQRQLLFGRNEIDVQEKSVLSLLVDEIIHPFYVFQIASIVLWCMDTYYYYALCIALISLLSITTTLIDTKKTIRRMREMSRFSCAVTVFIDGAWVDTDSRSLVPGDVIKLSCSQFTFFPADMFLLSGDAIVNESMLTGESVPVSKIPVRDNDLLKWRDKFDDVGGEFARSFLHSGTKVVRIRGGLTVDGSPEIPAIALVLRTGFNTTKGALIRSMLYPKPIGFQFYRDSIRFICVLAGIAGLGFCVSAVRFIRLGIDWQTIVLRALDLVTVVVPPALPAALSIGTSFALGRLRKLGIYCISPNRVNVGGKVNVCCFDKTGTLTADGLDILGVRGLDRSEQRFGELVDDVYDLPSSSEKPSFLHALASCHSLKMLGGSPIGDPLDVKMFEFTRWTLEEGHVARTGKIKDRTGDRSAALVHVVVRPPGSAEFRLEDALLEGSKHTHFLELGVIRTFEFVSSLRRMSVVVKRLGSTSMEIYVKGAPEVMAEICERNSFPVDYDEMLSYYTKHGYRVIAMAGKSVEGLSWLRAQKMRREQAESGLKFLGLIIFENKVKPGTAPVIQALRSAHLVCKMITGDNPLTAVSVARECNLINQAAHVFSPVFTRGNVTTESSTLEWSCMEDASWKLESFTLRPLPPPPHHTVEESELEHLDYSLVVTGDVFKWMINHAPTDILQSMLIRTQIFARMSPDEKNEVVEGLQTLGYSVLMCGDGANDCAALKAADVGISLSEAEASVAAPFTSSTPDISCVLDVIKEGRAALATSFSLFKYMALYSLIQFTTITLLYSFASSLGDLQFLYIDLFIIIPIAVTMGRTCPYPKIYHKRPTASLVSIKVLSSLIGQIVITSATQAWAFLWVEAQPWYEPPPWNVPTSGEHKLNATNFENSVLFLVSCFQYILVAAVFSIGPPFRQSMWTNGWLMFCMMLLCVTNLIILLSPSKAVLVILELMNLPFSGRWTLLLTVVLMSGVSLAFEQWGAGVVSQFVGWVLRQRRERKRWREGKAYKRIVGTR